MWDAFLDEKGRIIFDSFDLNWKTDSDFKITSFILSTYAALKTNQSYMYSECVYVGKRILFDPFLPC